MQRPRAIFYSPAAKDYGFFAAVKLPAAGSQ